ncbi:hypothetical protein V6N12_046785 [Hibiscus sabdariffa]|uniref:Uncharacterized protein n=1 Tax=Hibiscus sabdariffa TaxID=183260 RepID=A0ABR2AWN2_9ROSI
MGEECTQKIKIFTKLDFQLDLGSEDSPLQSSPIKLPCVGSSRCWERSLLSLLRSTSVGLAPEWAANRLGSVFGSWVDPPVGPVPVCLIEMGGSLVMEVRGMGKSDRSMGEDE